MKPNLTLIDFDRSFIHPLAGVDEVGRGTLAGPVVAAAVILDFKNLPDDINDSKKVSKKNREIISTKILENSITSIGHATVEEIDDINILRASLLAMKRAVEGLSKKPKLVLIDGNQIPDIKIESKSIIKGDNKSLSSLIFKDQSIISILSSRIKLCFNCNTGTVALGEIFIISSGFLLKTTSLNSTLTLLK